MSGTISDTAAGKAANEADLTNPVLDNIYARRSVRNFTDRQIPDGIMGEIIRAGTYAPSATNQQPWRFVVVRNAEKIRRYGQRAKKLWVEQYRDTKEPHLAALVRTMSRPEMEIFYDAPVLVLVFAAPGSLRGEIDCALAAENMMLAARSLGVGSCWIGLSMPLGSDREFRNEIGIPDEYTLAAPLIFGYPVNAEQRAPARNNDVVLRWID